MADKAEIAANITVAWLGSAGATASSRVTGEVVAEFYKTVYEAVRACTSPHTATKGYSQKPQGW